MPGSMRLRNETELNNGDATVPEIAANGHRSVAAAVADYLEETALTKKPKTLSAYTTALTYFTESCHKLNLEDIDRMDLLKFCAFLRDEKNQATTQRIQQVREPDGVPEGERDSWAGRQERLASLHRRRTGDVRDGRTGQALCSL